MLVKKISDSQDESYYDFKYDTKGNIIQIDYFSQTKKLFNQLKIIFN